MEDFIGIPIGYTSVDLQALVAETCGYWCCAYLYFINTFPQRTGDMYVDADTFCNLFNDLNHSCDWQTNETILKQFFPFSSRRRINKSLAISSLFINIYNEFREILLKKRPH